MSWPGAIIPSGPLEAYQKNAEAISVTVGVGTVSRYTYVTGVGFLVPAQNGGVRRGSQFHQPTRLWLAGQSLATLLSLLSALTSHSLSYTLYIF